MGDDLVNEITQSLKAPALANQVELSALHPIIDVIVNRIREWDHDDGFIRAILTESPHD